MSIKKYLLRLIPMLVAMFICMAPAQAAMVSNSDVLNIQDRAQLVDMLEREEVQKQLVEMGVDPAAAIARVDQMTDVEVAELNGQIAAMPAGAGIGTLELLLIIIIIILLV